MKRIDKNPESVNVWYDLGDLPRQMDDELRHHLFTQGLAEWKTRLSGIEDDSGAENQIDKVHLPLGGLALKLRYFPKK